MCCSDIAPLCLQVGYWNQHEKYVNTATYSNILNETFGLQNRTYVVTTILVSFSALLELYWKDSRVTVSYAFYFYFSEFWSRTQKIGSLCLFRLLISSHLAMCLMSVNYKSSVSLKWNGVHVCDLCLDAESDPEVSDIKLKCAFFSPLFSLNRIANFIVLVIQRDILNPNSFHWLSLWQALNGDHYKWL